MILWNHISWCERLGQQSYRKHIKSCKVEINVYVRIVYEILLYRYLVLPSVFDLFECSYFVIHDTSHILHDIEIWL